MTSQLCPHGHAYSEENTYVDSRGYKHCRTCQRDRMRKLRIPGLGRGGFNRIKTHCPQGHEYTEENTYTNPEGRRWCRECARANGKVQHAKKFGLTPEKIREMRDSQNNRCAICSRIFHGPCMMHIDHDHTCCPKDTSCGNCVRSLLCSQCNQGLGSFRDSVEILESAVRYLQTWKNKQGIAND